MKSFCIAVIFISLGYYSFGQDYSTLVKLNQVCVRLGSTRQMPADTLELQRNLYKMNVKMIPHLEFLLKAAEFYLSKDYEHSDYYIKQVHMNFRNIEYNNLKWLLLICNYIHMGDVQNSARFYYIISKINQMEPGSMKIIQDEISGNLERQHFDEALSQYFYYHQRLKILDNIYQTEAMTMAILGPIPRKFNLLILYIINCKSN